jgi:hypothetical protein
MHNGVWNDVHYSTNINSFILCPPFEASFSDLSLFSLKAAQMWRQNKPAVNLSSAKAQFWPDSSNSHCGILERKASQLQIYQNTSCIILGCRSVHRSTYRSFVVGQLLENNNKWFSWRSCNFCIIIIIIIIIIISYLLTYLLQLSFHSIAVGLTLVQTKQIKITIHKRKKNKTKHSKYKYTY